MGIDRQACLKKSKTRLLASSKLAELGGTFTLLNVNAILGNLSSNSTRSVTFESGGERDNVGGNELSTPIINVKTPEAQTLPFNSSRLVHR